MNKVKPNSWDACVDLDKKIGLFMNMLSQKYDVRIKTDSNYEKGTIRITIKDGSRPKGSESTESA